MVLSKLGKVTLKISRFMVKTFLWLMAALGVLTLIAVIITCIATSRQASPDKAKIVREAAAKGELAYRLSTPEELSELLNEHPLKTTVDRPDSQYLYLDYPSGVHAAFRRTYGGKSVFVLQELTLGGVNVSIDFFRTSIGGRFVDIGWRRQLVLRDESDLSKISPRFGGLRNASLVNVDLRNHLDVLNEMPFDTLTKWPTPDKLPGGFVPESILEEGKKPGLGLKRLHSRGINGTGVGIAIIDAPMLEDHDEYVNNLKLYDKGFLTFKPNMHGSTVASIAVGKSCGVAPGASLYFYAVQFAFSKNESLCKTIDKIVKLNNELRTDHIRVISLSTGMFPEWPKYDQWKQTVAKAEQNGIFVITCDRKVLNYGTLKRAPNKDADNPESYKRGRYARGNNCLLVPAGGITTACYKGPNEYIYWADGGMSWVAPYIGGLAALAFQVNPDLTPQEIRELLIQTATQTQEGPIINPLGFIDAAKNLAP